MTRSPAEQLWTYDADAGLQRSLCCGPQSRGVAVAYGKVFVAQLDGQLVALDARTGEVVWKTDPPTTHARADALLHLYPWRRRSMTAW